ncbi:DUF4238 domain-containing protein [Pseudomonas beijingensis]|uniref:DUF4238 domain-containing protein n=1 Tax=Pseudomonas beijingensis TaxID=2954101 RepID=UPI0027338CBE|nr:DUF4238 domain-containing protein [Pseudomonas sp. FP830]WLI46901.1 DUF4238 domain-containing protein [Pseudomonas sp. FP830]
MELNIASNKNQHFVPRCYLKPFTIKGEGAAINVYNLDRQRLITNAPVKNQCSRDYFYGQDDKLEKAIQSLEQGYGSIINEITQPGCKFQSHHQYILQVFWLFQYLRTEGACKRAAEMYADMFEPVGLDSDFSMSIKDAVQTAMGAFADNMDVVSDLKICLLKNATNVPFLASDDPAVLTNRWQLEDKRTRGGSLGLRDAGAILLLPLSPTIFCLGYDPDVYRVPSDSSWLTIRKTTDVEALNEFQVLNCRANLFVGSLDYADGLHRFVNNFIHHRPAARHTVNFAIFEGEETQEHKKYRVVSKSDFKNARDGIMHAQTISQTPSQWPSFLLRRNKSCAYYNGTGIGYLPADACSGDRNRSTFF